MSEIKEQITYQRYKALENDFDRLLNINGIYKRTLNEISNYLKIISNENIGYWVEDEEGRDVFIDVKDRILETIKMADFTIKADK